MLYLPNVIEIYPQDIPIILSRKSHTFAETVNQCHTCSLTGDKVLLDKATEIADKLMPAFKSPTGVPYALVNMRTGSAKNYPWTSGSSILSEFGTLHMEFAYLSDATGNTITLGNLSMDIFLLNKNHDETVHLKSFML